MSRYQWIEIAPGRKRLVDTERAVTPAARSSIGFPMLLSNRFDEPVQSQADGRLYDDKKALERSYRAENNPQGVDYECIGDAPVRPYERPARTREHNDEMHRSIARALDEAGI